MKVEFRKVPFEPKEFSFSLDSVIFEGQFGRISPTLAKFDANISGKFLTSCYKCGKDTDVYIDERADFIVSDGIYSDDKHEETVIEVDNNIIDFEQIVASELTSIGNDYHMCENCDSDDLFEKEF